MVLLFILKCKQTSTEKIFN